MWYTVYAADIDSLMWNDALLFVAWARLRNIYVRDV